MRFLLDANVLIDANRDYYPIERIPEFWDWLAYQGRQGNVKIPDSESTLAADKHDPTHVKSYLTPNIWLPTSRRER